MSLNQGLFSSASAEWETPQWLFDKLDAEFHFGLDACATPENAKCEKFFTKEDGGLTQSWAGCGAVFVNPPYGRQIHQWIARVWQTARAGITVVMLLPARTDSRWWHDYIMRASEIRFIKGRLRFTDQDGNTGCAPFPSAVVVFRPRDLCLLRWDVEFPESQKAGPVISTLRKNNR